MNRVGVERRRRIRELRTAQHELPLLHSEWRRGQGRGGAQDADESQEISPLPDPLPALLARGEGETARAVPQEPGTEWRRESLLPAKSRGGTMPGVKGNRLQVCQTKIYERRKH